MLNSKENKGKQTQEQILEDLFKGLMENNSATVLQAVVKLLGLLFRGQGDIKKGQENILALLKEKQQEEGEILFWIALVLIREFPGKFRLQWDIPGLGGEIVPFDPSTYVPPYGSALVLWLRCSNGNTYRIFNTSLPKKKELKAYESLAGATY